MEQIVSNELRKIEIAKDQIAHALGNLTTLLTEDAADLPEVEGRRLIWGSKVSPKFKAGVIWIENKTGINADYLMACMSFETAGTFDPAQRNMAGSSAVGLIQFMSFTAKALGTTTAELSQMDAVRQLSYVYKYFRQFGSNFSSRTLEDIYMYILFPKAVGKPNDWAMPWKYGSVAYKQNSGLDKNKDKVVTKGEAAQGVRQHYLLGKNHMG